MKHLIIITALCLSIPVSSMKKKYTLPDHLEEKISIPLIQSLLKKGISVNAQDYVDKTLLHHAVSANKKDCVQFLLNQNCKTNIKDNAGRTAFCIACMMGNINIITMLPSSELNEPDNVERTPLYYARDGNTTALLLSRGAHINMQDKFASDALNSAVYHEKIDKILVLLSNIHLTRKITLNILASLATNITNPNIKEVIYYYYRLRRDVVSAVTTQEYHQRKNNFKQRFLDFVLDKVLLTKKWHFLFHTSNLIQHALITRIGEISH